MEKSINSREHKIVADMVYQLRIAAGLRQSELAAMLNKPQSFVSKVESGERRLDIIEIRTVLIQLHTNLSDFANELESRISKR